MKISRIASATSSTAIGLVALVVSCSKPTLDVAHDDTPRPRAPLVVHEWGTFTSMQGAEGTSLDGLQHETESLPSFVHSRTTATLSPFHAYGDGSLDVPARHVNGKMETPVMYFYASTPQRVSVHVDFEGGLMTQWFPRATALPAIDAAIDTALDGAIDPAIDPAIDGAIDGGGAIDVAKIERSSLDWDVVLTPIDHEMPKIPAVSDDDAWAFARQVQAASVTTTGADGAKESERYLFYRGLGRLDLPMQVVVASGDLVVLRNAGSEPIPIAFILEVDDEGNGRFRRIDDIAPSSTKPYAWTHDQPMLEKGALVAAMQTAMSSALVAQGLYPDEAQAMVKTWSRTWFAAEGTRVLYLEPRALIDRVLPLQITPTPDALVRALVGRHEYLTVGAQGEVGQALLDRTSINATTARAANRRLARLGRFLEPAVRLVGSSTNDATLRKSAEDVLATFDAPW